MKACEGDPQIWHRWMNDFACGGKRRDQKGKWKEKGKCIRQRTVKRTIKSLRGREDKGKVGGNTHGAHDFQRKYLNLFCFNALRLMTTFKSNKVIQISNFMNGLIKVVLFLVNCL